jgi:V-type H+-transporting ATPase subunit a
MKMSIIIGVLHMIIGIFFSLCNHIHFGSLINVFFEFVPQILMMFSLFGYLVIIIIYKWLKPGLKGKPMLIRTLINMFLGITKSIEPDDLLYPGEKVVEVILVVIFATTIIWMLVPKPVILICQHRMKKNKGNVPQTYGAHQRTASKTVAAPTADNFGQSDYSLAKEEEEEEEFNIGEILVHQLIETIEFTLGCISNTASYLRLWALSLAHGELADVFFSYAMILIPKLIPVAGSYVGVAIWIGATFGILMAMEGLSAFLHCLRLHWVFLLCYFFIFNFFLYK